MKVRVRRARTIREAKGLSLMDVARKTTIHIGHLSKFERLEAELGLSKLQELASLYRAPIGKLVEIVETNGAKPRGSA